MTDATDEIPSDLTGNIADGLVAVKQRVTQHLLWWLGTWFLQTDGGIAYPITVLGHQATPALAARTLAAAIVSDEEVIAVVDVFVDLNPNTRGLTYRAEVQTIFGMMNLSGELPDGDS